MQNNKVRPTLEEKIFIKIKQKKKHKNNTRNFPQLLFKN